MRGSFRRLCVERQRLRAPPAAHASIFGRWRTTSRLRVRSRPIPLNEQIARVAANDGELPGPRTPQPMKAACQQPAPVAPAPWCSAKARRFGRSIGPRRIASRHRSPGNAACSPGEKQPKGTGSPPASLPLAPQRCFRWRPVEGHETERRGSERSGWHSSCASTHRYRPESRRSPPRARSGSDGWSSSTPGGYAAPAG